MHDIPLVTGRDGPRRVEELRYETARIGYGDPRRVLRRTGLDEGAQERLRLVRPARLAQGEHGVGDLLGGAGGALAQELAAVVVPAA